MRNVAVSGAAGRMGREIIAALQDHTQLQLRAAIQHPNSQFLDQDSGVVAGLAANNILFVADVDPEQFDVMIEFAPSGAIQKHLEFCQQHGKAMVVGSTGLNQLELSALSSAAKLIPIVYAANMSVGVTLCNYLLATAAKVLGEKVDIDIVETHHKKKLDAPSGTALQMAEAMATVNGKDIEFAEKFDSGVERSHNAINIASIRAGEVIGDHTVTFNSLGEQIEIAHKASNRQIYAQGSLRAASWVLNQPAGLYSMQQVLGLETANFNG